MKTREQAVGRIKAGVEPLVAPFSRSSTVFRFCKRHLSWSWAQSTESQQVVCDPDQMGVQLHPSDATEARFAQPAVALHPPEDLLDPLAIALADLVAAVPRGASVQSRRGSVLDLRNVRTNAPATQKCHKVFGVVALVGTETAGPQVLATLADHYHTAAEELRTFLARRDRELAALRDDRCPRAVRVERAPPPRSHERARGS